MDPVATLPLAAALNVITLPHVYLDAVTGAAFVWHGSGLFGVLPAIVGRPRVVYGVRQLGLAGNDARLGVLFSVGGIGALGAGLSLAPLARRVTQTRITLRSAPRSAASSPTTPASASPT